MSDPHLNIFHAYRGPLTSDAARERQLEDNLTRALIILLQTIRGTSAQAPLLRALGGPATLLAEPFQCYLQVHDADHNWPRSHTRRILVIHGGGKLNITSQSGEAERGRADAVITNAHFLLAVESKLGTSVSQDQLDRHRATLGIAEHEILTLSWTQLAQTVRSISIEPHLSPVARFVSQQFEEYLRMNGFGGLTEEHLAYFSRQPDQRDDLTKEGIRRSLGGLMEELQSAWQTVWEPNVGNIHQAARSAWAELEPTKPGNAPHLSISIDPAGLDLFGNIETDHPFQRFRRTWQSGPEGLLALIRQLGASWPPSSVADPPWRLSVVRRIERRPRTFDHWTAVDMALATLASWSDAELHWFVEAVTQRPAGEKVPEIKLMRSYPAALILGEPRLADLLVRSATQLEPLFAWLGEPVR